MGISYRRLNPLSREIRLLEIAPANSLDEPLKCRLITVRHDERLDYIALSTLFGDPGETETVSVNGKSVSLTTHIAQALKQVRAVFYPVIFQRAQRAADSRRQDAPRWLKHLFDIKGSFERSTSLRVWLDYLCINHKDEIEKSKQLVEMKQIYSQAEIVVGWLGEKTEHTDACIVTVGVLHDALPSGFGKPGDKREHPEDYSPTHKWAEKVTYLWASGEAGEMASSMPHWVGTADFILRPYFHRRWIIEELSSASFPAFLIGDRIVPWNTILSLYRVMVEFKSQPSNIFPPNLRDAIAELPLETADKLLDEFIRREALEESKMHQEIESAPPRTSRSFRSSW